MSKLYTLSRLHLFFMLLFYAQYLVHANGILVDYLTLKEMERLPLNIDLLTKNLEALQVV